METKTQFQIYQKLKNGYGESWNLWKNIARQATNGEFGNPDAFCSNVDLTNWMSATIETKDEEIIEHIMKICKRDPRSGKSYNRRNCNSKR